MIAINLQVISKKNAECCIPNFKTPWILQEVSFLYTQLMPTSGNVKTGDFFLCDDIHSSMASSPYLHIHCPPPPSSGNWGIILCIFSTIFVA